VPEGRSRPPRFNAPSGCRFPSGPPKGLPGGQSVASHRSASCPHSVLRRASRPREFIGGRNSIEAPDVSLPERETAIVSTACPRA
jgi:hypothetical protein